MASRVIPVLLACVMLGSPVMMTVCQMSCASADAVSQQAHQRLHHACHAASEHNGSTLGAAAHVCGHADEYPTGVEKSSQDLAPPTLGAIDAWLAPVVEGRASTLASLGLDASPPDFLTLSSQLRI